MAEPPSVDGHEITDKGYINQRATLERRKALVDKLYAGGEGVIEIPSERCVDPPERGKRARTVARGL